MGQTEFPDPPDSRRCVEIGPDGETRCKAWSLKNDPRQLCAGHAGLTRKSVRLARKKRAGTLEPPVEVHEILADRNAERAARWLANKTPPPLSEHERAEGWRWIPRQVHAESLDLNHPGLFKTGDNEFATWIKVPKFYDDSQTFNDLAVDRAEQRDREADARIEQDHAYLRTIHHDIRSMTREQIDTLPQIAIDIANLDMRMYPRGTTIDRVVDHLIWLEKQGIDVDLDSDETDKIVGKIVKAEFPIE